MSQTTNDDVIYIESDNVDTNARYRTQRIVIDITTDHYNFALPSEFGPLSDIESVRALIADFAMYDDGYAGRVVSLEDIPLDRGDFEAFTHPGADPAEFTLDNADEDGEDDEEGEEKEEEDDDSDDFWDDDQEDDDTGNEPSGSWSF